MLEVINDPKPPVRAAAIEALGRAIIGALGSLGPAASGSTAAASAAYPGAAAAAASESTGGVEHMLLVALEALYNADNERDVHAGVLRVLLSVLQVGMVNRVGRAGWRAVTLGQYDCCEACRAPFLLHLLLAILLWQTNLPCVLSCMHAAT